MRATTMYPEVEKYARDDFSDLCYRFQEKYGLSAELEDLDITSPSSDMWDDDIYSTDMEFVASAKIKIESKLVDFELSYIASEDGYWYTDYDEGSEEWLYRRYTGDYSDVYSATKIMAADDDPFDDLDPEDSDEIADNIDDMSDTLDELSETLQGFDEDEIDIETENNINDHFIAECEKCHGVFITAVILSDQEIEKISGVCPLCDEDCDQYLKWIIKEVE